MTSHGSRRAGDLRLRAESSSRYYDVVLSSGFLAFGAHLGFVSACDRVLCRSNKQRLRGVMGTSSGAITGALLAAGKSPIEMQEIIEAKKPLDLLDLTMRDGGLYSMNKLVDYLNLYLPETFEQLQHPFAVGVVDAVTRRYRIIASGPLAPAIVASAAVPLLFVPMRIGERSYIDGGVVERVGIGRWRNYINSRAGRSRMHAFVSSSEDRDSIHRDGKSTRPQSYDATPAIVHMVKRSSQFSGAEDAAGRRNRENVVVVSSKNADFFRTSLANMGDLASAKDATEENATRILTASCGTTPRC